MLSLLPIPKSAEQGWMQHILHLQDSLMNEGYILAHGSQSRWLRELLGCSWSLGFGSPRICWRENMGSWGLGAPVSQSTQHPFGCFLPLPALQRDILGLKGAASPGVESLAPGLSPISSPHLSSLEPSVGMSLGVGDSGWDELGQWGSA